MKWNGSPASAWKRVPVTGKLDEGRRGAVAAKFGRLTAPGRGHQSMSDSGAAQDDPAQRAKSRFPSAANHAARGGRKIRPVDRVNRSTFVGRATPAFSMLTATKIVARIASENVGT